MKIKVFSILVLLFASTPMIVSAQETAEMRQGKPKVKLSDALFYQQLTQQSTNAQAQKNVVFVSRKDPFVAGVLSLLTQVLDKCIMENLTKESFIF